MPKLPMQGSCRCERVQIRVTKAPLVTGACHCNGCQRMSSSAFSLTAIFPADAFEVTKGEPVIGGLHGPDAHHFFCAHCMTWMFTRPVAAPHIVNVRPSMFDDHAWFSPFLETFTSERLSWAITPAKHSYATFPPMESYAALLAEYAQNGARPR